jgi:Glycosyltransferase family 87
LSRRCLYRLTRFAPSDEAEVVLPLEAASARTTESAWGAAALPALVGIALFALTARLDGFPERWPLAEPERWARSILDGMLPYRDFHLPYPPGAIPVFLIPAPGGHGYELRYRVWIAAVGAAVILLLALLGAVVGARRRELYVSTCFVGISPLLLGQFPLFDTFDLWPALFTIAALTTFLCGHRRTAAGLLGYGAVAKVYPLAVFPLMLLYRRGRLSWRALRGEVTTFVAVVVLVNLPFAILGFHGLARTYSTLLRRPLQIESLGGSILLAAHQIGIYQPTVYVSFGGSQDLAGRLPDVLGPLSTLATLAALLWVWVIFARGRRTPDTFLTAAAASVAAFVAFGKVFSPGYAVWLLAIVPLARRLPSLALAAAAFLLTRLYFPDRYDDVIHLGAAAWIVLARNFAVVALFVILLVDLRRLSTGRASAPG